MAHDSTASADLCPFICEGKAVQWAGYCEGVDGETGALSVCVAGIPHLLLVEYHCAGRTAGAVHLLLQVWPV